MKTSNILFGTMLTFAAIFTQAQQADVTQKVVITFKNNSILVRKYSFITYAPNETGNGTTADFMMPFGTKQFTVLPGTKFYLASQKQVGIVMSGNKLTGEPFYIAKAEDNGKTIKLRKD